MGTVGVMPVETRWTAVGRPAFDVLDDVVSTLRAGDPLQPVTVVTPTAQAAVALRRALARSGGGIAAVGFQALDALAEQLAAPVIGAEGIALGVDRELVVAAVRVELSRDPGRLAAIAHHRSTWETLARAITEVAALDAAGRRSITDEGGLGAEVVRLHDAVARSVGVGGRVAVLRAAADRVSTTPDVLRSIGPVVVHLPGRLDPPSIALLRAVGAHGQVVVLAGASGVERADVAVVETVLALGGTAPGADDRPVPAVPDRVISANDVDDEIGAAIRALLAHAEKGVPFHAMALVHPSGAPYGRAVAEVLRAAGIPYSGPSTDTLGHTAPGRLLLQVLDVATSGFARQSLIDLWSSGVVVGSDGGPVASVRVDERTRRLGIIGGRAAWHERIGGRRTWLADNPVDTTGPEDVIERRRNGRTRELAELALLEELLATVEALIDALPSSWGDLGDWAATVLDTLCGPMARRSGWPAHDVDADTAVRTVLGRLADLSAVDPEPTSAVVIDAVRAALDAPAPRRATSGTGLLVTTLDHPPVVPLDAVVVLGLAEGHVPRLSRDDVLIGEHVRRRAHLPVGADATVDQHRALLTALGASSGPRILTYARSDQRSGRTQVPSRWLVDAVEQMAGVRPRSAPLITGAHVVGVETVHSHHHALAGVADTASAPLHGAERRLASLAAADDFDAHPAALEPVVAAGATAARSRAADAFTRFDGNVGEGIDVLAGDRHLSPTSIETYASCPRRWFFTNALGVGEVDRPEEVDRLQPRDKGTLAHRILERFVGEAIEAGSVPAPGESWGAAGDERLLEVAAEEFADFERRGLTGHPRWWDHDRHEIVGVLTQTLRRDDLLRAEHSATPVAVELTFGRDGRPPLEVSLDDGRVVAIAGQADRVDEVPGGVMVHDYKFASSNPYRGLDTPIGAGGDPLAGGRRLQLLTYAEAAAQQRGIDRASAWYWFLRPGHTGVRIGYEVTPEHRQLFRETLRVLVDAIGDGLYPARSGPYDWFQKTNANCGWCEFDSICPADREEEWERVRAHPALAEVASLAEDGSPAFLVTAPPDGSGA